VKYGKRYRILIVEDDSACAIMYQRALRFAGFEVAIAPDGLAALRTLEQQSPDLIVLDLQLPGFRGEAVLSEVAMRPDLRHIPVVVVTGSDASVAAPQAAAVLRKPCDPERLVAMVEEQLQSAA
jgi:DNA-binding response OmpR family regulator